MGDWAPGTTPQWVREEVSNGVQALIVLRLRNPPAADTIELTMDVWLAAIAHKVSIEQLDAPRIKEGFRRFFVKAREWPAPAQIIELMPPRKPLPAITHEISAEQRLLNKERLRKLAEGL